MDKHPIENLMTTTMDSIRDMVDVNTVVGEAIGNREGLSRLYAHEFKHLFRP